MIFIASDHAGFRLKSFVKGWLEKRGFGVCDLGVDSASRVDYPDYAKLLCQKLLESNASGADSNVKRADSGVKRADSGAKSLESSQKVDSSAESKIPKTSDNSQNLGILICGSGIGMSMSANRFEGIRAALCTSAYMAQMARAHNDANVLCMGERLSGEGEVESMLEAFFATPFEGGRHLERIQKIRR
ncbi:MULTISPECIES: ribose 5-phosphate isomerase B [unclassified Helicobacter]|uniref:ribose 5-phosphate isomerase B n=1 Tax=unclassified Helicobacter TaxID=2593540 RepID=UPI0009EDC54B|nr:MULTISPECIES: ribose 5-phosphate isomerase B [unclassified Helicobacter]